MHLLGVKRGNPSPYRLDVTRSFPPVGLESSPFVARERGEAMACVAEQATACSVRRRRPPGSHIQGLNLVVRGCSPPPMPQPGRGHAPC